MKSATAFGLFDLTMLPKINRLLKTQGLHLRKRTSRNWGDQVELTLESTPSTKHPGEYMVCFKCDKKVTTKDDIHFEGGFPVHSGRCPK
jgi:hypothetical protein